MTEGNQTVLMGTLQNPQTVDPSKLTSPAATTPSGLTAPAAAGQPDSFMPKSWLEDPAAGRTKTDLSGGSGAAGDRRVSTQRFRRV